MNESNLKREFSKRDVQRMRNLITGNFGEKTQVQAGYETKKEDRKEGDVWEEGERTWTIKNGIKQTITKLDGFKKLVVLPLCCPNCKKPMKNSDINKKMYYLHGECLNCVTEKESKIKLDGKWEEYTNNILNTNHKTFVNDLEQALEAWYKESESYITEAGDVEVWSSGNKKRVYQEIKEKLDQAKEKKD